MKLTRIEELLRTRPPDEGRFEAPLVLNVAATISVSSRARPARLRPLLGLGSAAIGVVAVAVLGLAVISRVPAAASPSTRGASTVTPQLAGVIPWLEATPEPPVPPEPSADPSSLSPCAPKDLALVAGGWSGATSSVAGRAMLINLGVEPCRIDSQLPARLSDANGVLIATGGLVQEGPAADPVAITPGAEVGTILAWTNWCGPEPKRPLSLSLNVPGGPGTGQLSANVDERGGADAPRCGTEGVGSGIAAVEFSSPEPFGGGYTPVACATDALSAYSGGWGAGEGTSYTQLVILNRGDLDCLLPASPMVELRDSGGTLLASTAPWPGDLAALEVPPAWTVVTNIAFADWCKARPALPMGMDIRLAGATLGVSLAANDQGKIPVPSCMSTPGSDAVTFALNAPFGVAGVPISEPDPLSTLPVRVSISPLQRVNPGSTLEFTVTLTNVTPFDKPLNLSSSCPSYTESVSLPNQAGTVVETYLLNCAAAGILQAGSSLTFAMRVRIPPDTEIGTAALVWQVGHVGPADSATFEVASSSPATTSAP